MPIRLVDKVDVSIGSVAVVLGDFDFDGLGSSVAPSSFTGTLSSSLDSFSSQLYGLFTDAPDRTGTIGSTLSGVFASFLGNGLSAPTWGTVPNISFVRGTASSFSVASYLSDPSGIVTSTEAIGSLPAGVTYSSANQQFDYDGTDTGSDITLTGIVLRANTSRIVNGVDAVASWNSRSTGAGILRATNFSEFTDTSDLQSNIAYQTVGWDDSQLSENSVYTTSGKALLIERRPDEFESAASWSMPVSSALGVSTPRFYCQVVIHIERDDVDWAFINEDEPLTAVDVKYFLIDWSGGFGPIQLNQIAVDNTNGHGFVVGFRRLQEAGPNRGYTGFTEQRATPWSTTDYALQPAIDRGTPNPVVTGADWSQRYGPSIRADNPDIWPLPDQRLSDQGLPHPDASIGGVLWPQDDKIVVTIFADYAADTCQCWAGRYGEAPVMIWDFQGTADWDTTSNNWDIITLTNFNTGGVPNPNRPTTRRAYPEVITSTQPIDHPGGFSLPGNLG